jgi:solute carrier family 50 (sugar transporter)
MVTITNPSSFVSLCGVLAPIASVMVGLSPMPTIQQIIRDHSVGSLPLLPYSTMIVNASLWFAYGLLKQNPSIWSCNGLCLVLGIYYFVIYIQFSPNVSPSLPGTVSQHQQVVGGTMIGTVLLIILPIFKDPAPLIGGFGCLIVVLLFASPLVVLRHVIESKDARSIPLPFTIACTVNCFLWTVFGLWQVNDFNIYFPNGLGLVLSLAQLILKIYFAKDIMKGRNKEPTLTEGRLLSIV